jgi:succinate dehydrogenase/fumarate reductase flavoprotein subunit
MLYDILVVGGGVAGLMAAIESKKFNPTIKVGLITKGNIFKSNSAVASGGINAVLDKSDKNEIQKHIDDTIKASYGLASKKAVEYMCNRANIIIDKLVDYGVEFDRDENGNISQRSFGGGSSKRTCYVGDKSGAAITQVLIKKAREIGVEFLVNHFVVNITKIDKVISGVVAIKRLDSSLIVYPAKAVVFAAGGYAGIYRGFSTNAPDYTGDLLAIALRNGLNLKDMEFVQFHPTGFVRTSYLVSEAARGEGGYLVNSDGERFVDELSTRDVVSQAVANEINSGKKVFIDLRHISPQKIESKLPSLKKAALNQAGIDVESELLEIKPVAHYSMGGIESNMTSTKIEGLFVCGECANVGVHGANRLGGNSLLEGVVFGELAGQNALKYIEDREFLPIDYSLIAKEQNRIDSIFQGDTTKNFNAMRITLGRSMFELAGISKDEASLVKAFDYLKYLRKEAYTLHTIDKSKSNNVELIGILELQNALEIAETVVLTALKREESRGAHYRKDFIVTKKDYQSSILVNELQSNYFKVWLKDNTLLGRLREFLIN